MGKLLSARAESSAAATDGGGPQSPTHISLTNNNTSNNKNNNATSKSGASATSAGSTPAAGGTNPHKYLLYKPSFAQLIAFLAAAFKELPANGVLLLYISAEGASPPPLTGAAARAAKQLDEDPCTNAHLPVQSRKFNFRDL